MKSSLGQSVKDNGRTAYVIKNTRAVCIPGWITSEITRESMSADAIQNNRLICQSFKQATPMPCTKSLVGRATNRQTNLSLLRVEWIMWPPRRLFIM
eukprot:7777784-Karenia_brevis.AAC.1